MRSILSPSLRSRYDYYYSSISPGSTAVNYYENQNQSLFGDPVPPATDFLEELDQHLYGGLRRSSIGINQIIDDTPSQNNQFGEKYIQPTTVSEIISNKMPPDIHSSVERKVENSYNLPRRSRSSFVNGYHQANVEFSRYSNGTLIPVSSERIHSSKPIESRRLSNTSYDTQNHSSDSQDSHDWIEPQSSDWERLSSTNKNVTEFTHGNAMVAIIQNSTTSSSDERPSSDISTGTNFKQIHVLPYVSRKNSKSSTTTTPPVVPITTASSGDSISESITRDLSPIVIRETVNTGSAYRIQQPRQHKKTSFAIINEHSPTHSGPVNSSRSTSPFRGKGFKPHRTVSRTSSPDRKQHLSRHSASADGINANNFPLVQFNIQTTLDRSKSSTSIVTPRKMKNKTNVARQLEKVNVTDGMQSYEIQTDIKHKTLIQIPSKSTDVLYDRTNSVLPSSIRKGPLAAPRKKIHNSTGDLTERINYNNPKSYQKGLLRVVNSQSPSKIPRRMSISTSSEILNQRRNSSSLGTVTGNDQSDSTIEFENYANVQPRSLSRISKPTTLSPILGTPSKESGSIEVDESSKNLKASRTRIPRANTSLALKTNSKKSNVSESTQKQMNSDEGKVSNNDVSSRAGNKKQFNITRSKSTLSKDTKSVKPTSKPATPSAQKKITGTASSSSINKSAASSKKPPIDKKTISGTKKESIPSKSETTSSVKREASNAKKPPINVKQNTPSSIKREPSLIKRQQSNLSRNSYRQSTKGASTKGSKTGTNDKKDTNNSANIEKNALPSEEILDKPNDTEDKTKEMNQIEEEQSLLLSHSEIVENSETLVPLTNPSTVAMTTAAITAQPVQISTAVVANQTTLTKSNSSGQLLSRTNSSNQFLTENMVDSSRDSVQSQILEKSQKTLENIQKTVAEATDEIQKTIEVNLTDLKSLESTIKSADMRNSVVPLEKKDSSRTLRSINENAAIDAVTNGLNPTVITTNASPIGTTMTANENNVSAENRLSVNHEESDEKVSVRSIAVLPDVELESGNVNQGRVEHSGPALGANNMSSQNEIDANSDTNENSSKCCIPCCRRSSKKQTSSEISIHELNSDEQTTSCWKKLKCCKTKMEKTMSETTMVEQAESVPDLKTENEKTPGKCRLCLDKIFCCRKTNKIESSMDNEEVKKCCFCIPRRKKQSENIAWDESQSRSNVEQETPGCCSRLCSKLNCCKKKEKMESRRPSMASKKQSIAPTLPPEDIPPKLDMSLVEHTSMMKAAIPVLPVCLAWFCLICNCLIPGLGTAFSGLFCLCLGIPRFNQKDSARARIGSFIINIIVGVAQTFTLIFCLVGWGWSIWWGTIMLRIARKHKKFKLAEEAELQDENATSSNAVSQNHRDVEANKS